MATKVSKRGGPEQKKQKFVNNGEFLSGELDFGDPTIADPVARTKQARAVRRRLCYFAKKVAHILVARGYLVTGKVEDDCAKAPMNNKPQREALSRQALNCFFSTNKAKVDDTFVHRNLYGYLTAHVTGLDQRDAQVHHPFPELLTMASIIQKALKDSGFDLKKRDIDLITVKVYYNYYCPKTEKWHTKVLNPHTDVVYNVDGSVARDNNQEPGLPVVIYNMGDTKRLHFQLKEHYGHHIPGEEFYVRQPDNHCFVLSAFDEVPEIRGKTTDAKYLACWTHDSFLEDPKHGIAISLQFRFGKLTGPVYAKSGHLKDPCQPDKTSEKFDEAEDEDWMSGDAAEAALKAVYEALIDRFVTENYNWN